MQKKGHPKKNGERLPQAPWSSYPTDVTSLQRPEPHDKPHELNAEEQPASPAEPTAPHYHAVLFPVSEREVGYREVPEPPRTLGATRLAAVFLGLFYVLLALSEGLLLLGTGFAAAGGTVVLEYAQPHNSLHWLVAVVLVAACFTRDPSTRLLVLSVGVLFAILAVAGFLARSGVGSALGHGGPLPWSYVVASAVTAVIAVLAGLASRAAFSPPQPGMGRTA